MAVDIGCGPVVMVVGLSDSVHTFRWLDMLLGRGVRFVLVPVYEAPLVRQRHNIRKVATADDLAACSDADLAVFDLKSVHAAEIEKVQAAIGQDRWHPSWLNGLMLTEPGHLVVAIQRLRPALVHSMVVQIGGYLTLRAKEYLKDEFPLWLLSNWGSDIFLFRSVPEHRQRILKLVASIDGYHAECERDIRLVRQLGFRGMLFPRLPASGGMDFSTFRPLEAFQLPSRRREILIKGYHNWAGRALHILSAIHLAADELRPYRIRVALATDEVRHAVETMAIADNLNIVIEPYLPKHSDALMRLGDARAVVGLGIADGISTTLLEAMSVGTFPVQGARSCGDEWMTDGVTGILVCPHDVHSLSDALRRVATDDALVDAAAPVNRGVVEERWNSSRNAGVAVQSYMSLMQQLPLQSPSGSVSASFHG